MFWCQVTNSFFVHISEHRICDPLATLLVDTPIFLLTHTGPGLSSQLWLLLAPETTDFLIFCSEWVKTRSSMQLFISRPKYFRHICLLTPTIEYLMPINDYTYILSTLDPQILDVRHYFLFWIPINMSGLTSCWLTRQWKYLGCSDSYWATKISWCD